jgi:hypothetical protein
MRNIVVLLVLIFTHPTYVLADTTPDGRPIIYCPDHVECTEAGNIDSCNLSKSEYGIWSVIGWFNQAKTQKGIYNFEAVSTRDWFGLPFSTLTCVYKNSSNPRIVTHIVASIDKYAEGSILEPESISTDNNWWVIDDVPKCESDTKLCPMVETPEIAFDPRNLNNFRLSINGNILEKGNLSYDELLLACGATSICYVNVETTQNGRDYTLAGFVRVDVTMPDKVEIVYISTAKDSPCQFKRKIPFNLIYCDPIKQTRGPK